MVKLCKELLFIHYGVDASLLNNATLVHLLHRIELFLLLFLNFPYLSKATSANHIVKHEVILVRRYITISEI